MTGLMALGPLEVRVADGPVKIAVGKQREVLAALLVEVGRPVEMASLITRLWPERPPSTAQAAVRNHVCAVRRALHAVPGTSVHTLSRGYVLHAETTSVDTHRFTELVGRGRRALGAGDAHTAVSALHEALDLWRGPALVDLVDQGGHWPEAAALDQCRIDALEHRVEADLMLGRHQRLVAELERWTREHPRRERLRAQHMLALYRSGRQAHALAVYGEVRDHLREHEDRPPGPALRRLHQSIIEQRADLADSARAHDSDDHPVVTVAEDRPAAPDATVDELREVVAVTLRLHPRQHDTDLAGIAATLLTAVLDEVADHGGWAVQVVGRTVLVLFGVPRSTENDAAQALAAALAVRRVVRGRGGYDVAAAVASGTVLTRGARGAAAAPRVLGPVIDTCARLLDLTAPGSIVMCDVTRTAAGAGFEYRAAPTQVIGSPGSVWEVVSPRRAAKTAPDGPAEFVGRDSELGMLTSVVARLADRPHLATVIGAAGLGKTALVREAQQRSGATTRWCWAKASVAGRLRPAGPGPADPVAEALTADLARLLDPSRGVSEAEAWRAALLDLGRPVVLVVDDLHRADDPLLDLLERLGTLTGPVPLLIISIARPELFTRRPTWGGGQRDALTLTVPPLAEADLRRLLRAAAPDGLSGRRLDELCALACGNPRFAVEHIAALAEPAGTSPTPLAVRRLIGTVLDALSPQQSELLRAVSIPEQDLTVPTLAPASVIGPDGVAVAELVERQLLRLTPGGLAVASPTVRAAVIERIPAAVLAELRSYPVEAG